MQRRLATLLPFWLLERIDGSYDGQRLVGAALIQRLHGSQLHRLCLSHHIGRAVARLQRQQYGHKPYYARHLYAAQGKSDMTAAEEIPTADANDKQRAHYPRRRDGVAELVDGERRQRHVKKRGHLVAHRVRIELAAHWILHPAVSHQYPPRAERRTDARKPGGSQVEAAAHLLPAEEHDSDKSALHKEGHNALYRQRSTEDVADKPGIVAPVGAELKLKHDARSHANGKVYTEQTLPEFCRHKPVNALRTVINGFHNAHDQGKSQGQRHKQPMVDGCHGKLHTSPVNRRRIDVHQNVH